MQCLVRCPLDGKDSGRATGRRGFQSDDECKKPLSVCVCDIVATVPSCPLDGKDSSRATGRRGFQSDDECKKPLSVCV